MSERAPFFLCLLALVFAQAGPGCGRAPEPTVPQSVAAPSELAFDTTAILVAANQALEGEIKTITDYPAPNSSGGLNDYYSEGRYWWPNPQDPDGPYIQRDGESNPNLFTHHRRLLGELGDQASALAVAYLQSGQERFLQRFELLLNAWFVADATRMAPHLRYAQAIKGKTQGRGIGIIDTRSLLYVALAFEHLRKRNALSPALIVEVARWFAAYGDWLVTHPQGRDEAEHGNNHSSWWGAQLAAFAKAGQRPDLLDTAQLQYKRQLTRQLATSGIFPREVERTRPFHYTEYNLDALATLAHLASTPTHDLWSYKTLTGSLRDAVDYYLSFYGKLEQWPYPSALEPKLNYEPAAYLWLSAQRYPNAHYSTLWDSIVEHQQGHKIGAAPGVLPKHAAYMLLLSWPSLSSPPSN